MFNPNWDWQITGTATWFDELSDSSGGFFDSHIKSDLDFQTIDLDAGYHFDGNPLTRFLFGIRVLHSEDNLRFTADFVNARHTFDAEGWAVGPRVGIQSETMLGSSNFGFVAEASGSILFGSFDTDTYTSETDTSDSFNDSRTLYNLEGLAGLSWHASDRLTFTAGYRLQQWWNLREGTGIIDEDDFSLTADGDPLVHGPFLRAATTF
jgi:hypothetical protein